MYLAILPIDRSIVQPWLERLGLFTYFWTIFFLPLEEFYSLNNQCSCIGWIELSIHLFLIAHILWATLEHINSFGPGSHWETSSGCEILCQNWEFWLLLPCCGWACLSCDRSCWDKKYLHQDGLLTQDESFSQISNLNSQVVNLICISTFVLAYTTWVHLNCMWLCQPISQSWPQPPLSTIFLFCAMGPPAVCCWQLFHQHSHQQLMLPLLPPDNSLTFHAYNVPADLYKCLFKASQLISAEIGSEWFSWNTIFHVGLFHSIGLARIGEHGGQIW